jgi:phosphoribosyl 1,2-cyclic phosphodiesterase
MKLKVLSSSSKGNCYILETHGEALIIEAGVPMAQIKQALNFNTYLVNGCLVSHRHKDHSGHVHEVVRAGIDVYAPGDVFWYSHNRNRPVVPGKGFLAGRFKVMPFEVEHDVPCFGYHVEHPEMGRLVFMTDTYMSKYTFSKVNHWLVEANYSDGILEESVINGHAHSSMKHRLMTSHMELSQTINMLKANDLSHARNIILLHLSDGNSNEKEFIQEVVEQTGKMVYAASKGLEVDLSIH